MLSLQSAWIALQPVARLYLRLPNALKSYITKPSIYAEIAVKATPLDIPVHGRLQASSIRLFPGFFTKFRAGISKHSYNT